MVPNGPVQEKRLCFHGHLVLVASFDDLPSDQNHDLLDSSLIYVLNWLLRWKQSIIMSAPAESQ